LQTIPELIERQRQLGVAFAVSLDIALGRVRKSLQDDALKTLGVKSTDKISGIKYSGSDPHGHFESVLMLDFDNARIVYKPSTVDGH